MSGELRVGQNTNLDQLKNFLDQNAGKDIRARKDEGGSVTLYARSGWKPSARFLTKFGDMSGRTAKQDLAKNTIKGIMTRAGVPEGQAEQLLGRCSKKNELLSTSRGNLGIYIQSRGFAFPGMEARTGLSSVVKDAKKLAAEANLEAEQLQSREEAWLAKPVNAILNEARTKILEFEKAEAGEAFVKFVGEQDAGSPFMEKFNHITNATRNPVLFALELGEAGARKNELAQELLPQVREQLTESYHKDSEAEIGRLRHSLKHDAGLLEEAIQTVRQSVEQRAAEDAPQEAARMANQQINNSLIEKFVLESEYDPSAMFSSPEDYQITGGAGNCARPINALRSAYESGSSEDTSMLLTDLRTAALGEFTNSEKALERFANKLTEIPDTFRG